MRWTSPDTVRDAASDEAPPFETGAPLPEVLVHNQDPELRAFVQKALYAEGVSSVSATSEAEIFACLRRGGNGPVVLGIEAPESLELLARIHREFPGRAIVAVARVAGPELVRDVLRSGAVDFFFGSLNARKFLARLRALEQQLAQSRPGPADVESLETGDPPLPTGAVRPAGAAQIVHPTTDDYRMVCLNPSMKRVLEIAETVGPTESTVLVQGESGTGKELIAKRIHRLSKRGMGAFVEVNCGALPENLLESQLFGHERGSFTGAVQRQVGLFEIANQGTIFLDEIGEMSPDMQVKLLRVLQFREFRRIGGSQNIKVDVRVIAATNKDLKAEVEKKHFRPDLFFRLNVICLQIPPLRERLEEIPALVEHFCSLITKEKGLARKNFSSEAVEKLQKYTWSGNVRELENAVERLVLLSKGDIIEARDVEEHLGQTVEMSFPNVFAPTLTLDEVKRIHIANVLRENGGNKMKTARILDINVKTLYNLIKSLGIQV